MAKKKQLKIDINNALKGKTYDLKNISDIYISHTIVILAIVLICLF